MQWFWALLPDEALPLVVVAIGLLLTVGVIKRQAAMSILGGLSSVFC